MRTVRLKNNTVVEIIPEYAHPVEYWYGSAFAAQCTEAPDEVEQRWCYDPDLRQFTPPALEPEPEPSPLDRLEALEEALAQTDETAIALFESRAEQESINAQQDDALLDIYEMLGG